MSEPTSHDVDESILELRRRVSEIERRLGPPMTPQRREQIRKEVTQDWQEREAARAATPAVRPAVSTPPAPAWANLLLPVAIMWGVVLPISMLLVWASARMHTGLALFAILFILGLIAGVVLLMERLIRHAPRREARQ